MNYKNHKDQKLLSEAYVKVKQNNDVVNEGIFQATDPSTYPVAAAALLGMGALKGGKKIYSWVTGWTKENKEIYNQIWDNFKENYPDYKSHNPLPKEVLEFLYDHGFLTPFVYNKIFKPLQANPTTLLGLQLAAIFKNVAIERGKKLGIGRARTDEIKKFLKPTPVRTTPAPSQTPAPHPDYENDY